MFVSDARRISRPPIPCFCLNFSSHDGLLILVSASLKGRAYMRACSWISESDTCRPLCCSLRNQLASVLSMSGILPLAFLIGALLRSSGFSHLSLRLRTLDTVLFSRQLSWFAFLAESVVGRRVTAAAIELKMDVVLAMLTSSPRQTWRQSQSASSTDCQCDTDTYDGGHRPSKSSSAGTQSLVERAGVLWYLS